MDKIIQLANVIDGNAPDVEGGRTADDSGVYCLHQLSMMQRQRLHLCAEPLWSQ